MSLKGIYKRYGFCGILLNMSLKLLSGIGVNVEVNYLLAKKISPFSEVEERRLQHWGIQRLSLQDFKQYGNVEWFTERKLKHIEKLLESPFENECFGIIQGSQLVCSGWLSLHYLEDGEDKLLLPNGVGYLWDTYTNPLFRGAGFHGKLIKYRLYQLSMKGYSCAYSVVAVYNRASYRGFVKNGFMKKQLFFTYEFWNSKKQTTLRLR